MTAARTIPGTRPSYRPLGSRCGVQDAAQDRRLEPDGTTPHGDYWDVPLSVSGVPGDAPVSARLPEQGWQAVARVHAEGGVEYYRAGQPESRLRRPPLPQAPLVDVTASIVDAFVSRVAAG